MQWDDLSAEQQAIVNDWMTPLTRPVAGEIARALYHLDVTKTAYDATGVAAVLALLDNDAEIPNAGGLAGATALTKDELQPMLQALNALLLDYYDEAHKELWMKLAGAQNILG